MILLGKNVMIVSRANIDFGEPNIWNWILTFKIFAEWIKKFFLNPNWL